jgi:hypothetical protein
MPRPPKWNGETVAIRVPKHCAPELLAIAKMLDSGFKVDDWDESLPTALDKTQALIQLWYFAGHVEALLRECDRTGDSDRLRDRLWFSLKRMAKEASYRMGLWRRYEEIPPRAGWERPDKCCPLLSGLKVGDRCELGGNSGAIGLHTAPGGDVYTVLRFDNGLTQCFNSTAAANIKRPEVTHAR